VDVTRIDFFTRVLQRNGWPVADQSLLALTTVAVAEGAHATWNPTDTILWEPGATPYNSFGPGNRYHVWNFPDLETGVTATARTIGAWPVVAAAFREASSARVILAAYDESDGVGGNYYTDALPYVAAKWPAIGLELVAGSDGHPQPIGEDVDVIVQAAGDAKVYVVGGIPPVKYHLSPSELNALEAFGYPRKNGVPPADVAAIPEVGAGVVGGSAQVQDVVPPAEAPAAPPADVAPAEPITVVPS
jgi:hypothetical protein